MSSASQSRFTLAFSVVALLCLGMSYCAFSQPDQILTMPGVAPCRDRVCFAINGVNFAIPRRFIRTISSNVATDPVGISSLVVDINLDNFLALTNAVSVSISKQRRASTLEIWISRDVSNAEEWLRGALHDFKPSYELVQSRHDVEDALLYEQDHPDLPSIVPQIYVPTDAPQHIFYKCSRWRGPRPALPLMDEDAACLSRTYFDPRNPALSLRLEYQVPRSMLNQRVEWDKKIRLLLDSFIFNPQA